MLRMYTQHINIIRTQGHRHSRYTLYTQSITNIVTYACKHEHTTSKMPSIHSRINTAGISHSMVSV